ncbi:MAG: PKD domain-containing protein [Pricia sp.]
MKTDKIIHVIHALDGDQHLGNLQNILESLKNERRITEHIAIESDAVTSDTLATIGTNDMVMILLTDGVTSNKVQIEERLLKLRDRHTSIRVAEVIVDNIPYEEQFIAFPTDLKPIRSREDMDRVWKNIGDSLRDMIAVEEEEPTPPPPSWKKWVPYLIGFLVLAALVYTLYTPFNAKPHAAFSYTVLDPVNGFVDEATDCYIPCKVKAVDESTNAKSIEWNFQDTTLVDEPKPVHVFSEPGKYDMNLLTKNGGNTDAISKTLNVHGFPLANFEIENNGCTAPCEVNFKNTSENASNYTWNFIGGTSPIASEDENPGKRNYNDSGKFKVKLAVADEAGFKTDTTLTVTILKDNSPFADFTYRRTSVGFAPPHTYRFTSTSKNAGQMRWEIHRGTQLIKVDTRSSFTHELPTGNYSVKLSVTGGGGRDEIFKNLNVGHIFTGSTVLEMRPNVNFNKTVFKNILITKDSLERN